MKHQEVDWSAAGKKAWETRRKNEAARSGAARKAWDTRHANKTHTAEWKQEQAERAKLLNKEAENEQHWRAGLLRRFDQLLDLLSGQIPQTS